MKASSGFYDTDLKKYLDGVINSINNISDSAKFVDLSAYWATYNSLSAKEKKWYSYWRNQFIFGNKMDTSTTYYCIFGYELINGVLWKDSRISLQYLAELKDFSEYVDNKAKRYISWWYQDLYMYHTNDNIVDDSLLWVFKDCLNIESITKKVFNTHLDREKVDNAYTKLEQTYGTKLFNKVKENLNTLKCYYDEHDIDVIDRWLTEVSITQQRSIDFSSAVSFRRKKSTKYKLIKTVFTDEFYNDLNDCYLAASSCFVKVEENPENINMDIDVYLETIKIVKDEKAKIAGKKIEKKRTVDMDDLKDFI